MLPSRHLIIIRTLVAGTDLHSFAMMCELGQGWQTKLNDISALLYLMHLHLFPREIPSEKGWQEWLDYSVSPMINA